MKELKLTTQEAVNYLKENVKIHDDIEISYNRIFAEGEVLNMDFSEYFGEPGFKMLVSLDQSQLGSTVEIDIYELQDDIIEFIHKPKNGEEVYVTVSIFSKGINFSMALTSMSIPFSFIAPMELSPPPLITPKL